jgi:tetratricopeptide (TPR) repeat protein
MRRLTLLAPAALAFFLSCTEPQPARSNTQLLQEAERAMLQAQWDRAASQYEAFLVENPVDPQRAEIRLQIGKCRLGAARTEQAIRTFDQALNDSPPPAVKWELLFRRAVAHRIQGDFARAAEGFRSVASAPTSERGRSVGNDELHYEYATALFRTGNFTAAQAELKLVSPTGPYERDLGLRLGLTAYSVQVGAFGNEDLARAEAGKLSAQVRAVPGTPARFLVLVGKFAKVDEAQRELSRLQRQGYTDAFILP